MAHEKRTPSSYALGVLVVVASKLRLIGPDGGVSGDGEPSGPPNAREI